MIPIMSLHPSRMAIVSSWDGYGRAALPRPSSSERRHADFVSFQILTSYPQHLAPGHVERSRVP